MAHKNFILKRVVRTLAKPAQTVLLVLTAAIVILAAVVLFNQGSNREENRQWKAELAKIDTETLHKKVVGLESKVRRLLQERERLYPAGPSILVDTAENKIYLLSGSKVLWEAKCSTGSGLQLTDESGNRTWTFETPRGHFSVRQKITNPVWFRPDWAFIEEGEPIPKSRSERAVPDVLGDYALAFGNGYFIHGTLYTRTLGNSVTHGCIRVDDATLEKLFKSAKNGTPIWVF